MRLKIIVKVMLTVMWIKLVKRGRLFCDEKRKSYKWIIRWIWLYKCVDEW